MSERPIIFSGPMVKAILDGRKTMTRRKARRAVTVNDCSFFHEPDGEAWRPSQWTTVNPGSRLWVRETWAHDAPDLEICRAAFDDAFAGAIKYGPYYKVGEPAPETLKWRSPIHMPRWASRITLEVTGVRVERLHDISDNDAIAEGCPGRMGPNPDFPDGWDQAPVEEFRDLWNSLHGAGAWEANPDVVAISFRMVAP